MQQTERKRLHQAFEVGIWLKLFDGFWQAVGGVILVVVPNAQLHGWLADLTEHDLTQTTHSFLTHLITHLDASLTHGVQYFAAAYLLAHGGVKLFLGVNLLRRKLWAYPLTGIVLAIFILYQVYQLGYSWSWGLFVLTIFDIIFLGLTTVEYRHQRSEWRAFSGNAS